MVRRTAFDRRGGCDQTLNDLVIWELLLGLATLDVKGVLVGIRSDGGTSALAAATVTQRMTAARRIIQKHRAAFGAHAADALTQREAVARRLWRRERELVARRAVLSDQLRDLMNELELLGPTLLDRGQGLLDWRDLRRTTPLSTLWGFDRGQPVDRHYIESFLHAHADDVRGVTLELLDSSFTRSIGGTRVERADVLDLDPANASATVVADLRCAPSIRSNTYDCFVLTQTLHFIDDMPAAIREAHRILKPGGVLLATLPCASRLEVGTATDRWRVTPQAARELFGEVFGSGQITVHGKGNVLSTTAFLYGLAASELSADELAAEDPAIPLIVTVRAVKKGQVGANRARPTRGSAILLYHRVADLEKDPYQLAVSEHAFRTQLELLHTYWRPLSLRDLAAAAVSGEPLEGAIALTFDDAYLDNLKTAAPALGQRATPATFFVTTEPLERRRQFWWDLLQQYLSRMTDGRTEFAVAIDGAVTRLALGTTEQSRELHDELYKRLQVALPAERDEILWQLSQFTPSSLPLADDCRPMIASELLDLRQWPNITIGAHGVHHLDLARVPGSLQQREVFECRSALERLLERPVESFAYPFGSVSPAAVAITQAADFQLAVTCEERALRAHEYPQRLPRLQVPNVAGADFVDWLGRFVSPAG